MFNSVVDLWPHWLPIELLAVAAAAATVAARRRLLLWLWRHRNRPVGAAVDAAAPWWRRIRRLLDGCRWGP